MQTSQLKVSIITVCLNAVTTIDVTIKSVLSQTYKNIEYLVIDGASNDGTVPLLEKYKQQGVIKFISEKDEGIYSAMNKGIRVSTGDIILFLNAGDYFVSSEVIDFYLSKIRLNDADLFFGRIIWVDPLSKNIVLSDSSSMVYVHNLKEANFPHSATIYKKKLFFDLGFFDESYVILGDYEWNVRALLVGKVKFQYIDIIITVFFANGISNDRAFREQRLAEAKKIKEKYFAGVTPSFKKDNANILIKFLGKKCSNSSIEKLNKVY